MGPIACSMVYMAARPQTRQRFPTEAAFANQPAGSPETACSSIAESKA